MMRLLQSIHFDLRKTGSFSDFHLETPWNAMADVSTSYGFPMGSLWVPYGFPMGSLWIPYGFPMDSLYVCLVPINVT